METLSVRARTALEKIFLANDLCLTEMACTDRDLRLKTIAILNNPKFPISRVRGVGLKTIKEIHGWCNFRCRNVKVSELVIDIRSKLYELEVLARET